jgi:hypothetical protein
MNAMNAPVSNAVVTMLRRAGLRPPLALPGSGLAAVPLVIAGDADADLLVEAVAAGTASVSEVSEEGSVSRLLVRHDGARPLLLLHGEEVLGARQNRILNASFLAPARGLVELPVSCVERGRWGGTSWRFEASGTTAASSVRGASLRRVTRSVTGGGSYDTDQDQTWRDVDGYLERCGTRSETSSHRDALSSRLGVARDAMAEIQPQPDWAGMAFARGGRLVSLDLFGSPGLFARAWKTVALGVLAEVFDGPAGGGDPVAVVEAALAQIRATPLLAKRGVGLGETLHGSTSVAVGAVADGGRVYHLYATQAV